jgi:hypothetical protein
MPLRRRFEPTATLEDRLAEEVRRSREEAEKLARRAARGASTKGPPLRYWRSYERVAPVARAAAAEIGTTAL